MIKNKLYLAAAAAVLPAFLFAGVEEDHLKLYASFDQGPKPEIAKEGAALHEAGTIPSVEGKFGKALHFNRKEAPGDLWYKLGNAMKGDEWSISFWIKLDEAAGYNPKGSPRGMFRTEQGWMNGNAFGAFDNWGKFNYTHFSGDKKYCGASMGAQAFPANQWLHVTFTFKKGKHAIYINGNEAAYLNNTDTKVAPPGQNMIRIGSMDYRAKDQLNGAIDELKIFDKALNAGEIKEIMETIPGKKKIRTVLYRSFDGNTEGIGGTGVSTAELIFRKTKHGEGVKIVRHGYDRRGVLSLNGVAPHGENAASFLLSFIPDWNGAEDSGQHGLFHFSAGGLKYRLYKENKELIFLLETDGKTQKIALDAALLSKEKTHRICGGYDFKTKKIHLAVDGRKKEEALKLSAPASPSRSGTMHMGDMPGSDTYSKTQAEGTLDDFLVVDAMLSPEQLEKAVESEQKKTDGKQAGKTVVRPIKEQEKALWDLNGAERIRTATRERITLNALWRFQLTDAKRPFNPDDWIYLAVPGRYSGQANGMTDCEFYMRDRNLRKLQRNALYDNRATNQFLNSWFERSFVADPAWKGRRIVLKIDELSRSQGGTVYLNGGELAKLDTAGRWYEIPIPRERLNFGKENYLTIHAVDGGQYWAWRGIKGNIYLEIKNPVSSEFPAIITSVKNKTIQFETLLTNTSGKTEDVRVEASVSGENAPSAPMRSSFVTLNPGESRTVRFSGTWKNAKLWSHETPNLYSCTFSVRDRDGKLLDETEKVRFGFREFEIRGRDYYLNGKKIHLFNHDGWVNSSSDLDEARRVARTLKKLGYNAVRTNFPVEAKDNYADNIMKVCDEEGLLQFVGIDGVTGREYALWNDPAVREALEKKMAGMIRHWRNHPSNIMYFLSTNFLGYGWDYHPLKMADGYQPSFGQNKYKICLEGVRIMRKYDPTRPYFFQAGGNFGEVITTNAYFCWWPQTERNAWPQEWSKIGQKPLTIIETSFPYWGSFFGMDLKYQGQKPLFYLENIARYYGPDTYRSGDEIMLREIAKTTQGKHAEIWYDSPDYQKLKSDLLIDTISSWRGFGMSGICPFAEIVYAFERNAPYHTNHNPKTWPVEAKEFRKTGWTPDLRKIQYGSDMVHDKPLPTAHALAESMAPKVVFLDGGAAEPVDRTHHYYSGAKMEKRIVLINDTLKDAEFRGSWNFGTEKGEFRETLSPGENLKIPIRITIPPVAKKTAIPLNILVATPGIASPKPFSVTVYPRKRQNISGVAIYDTVGKTAKKLESLGINSRKTRNLSNLNGIRLLVIGTESLTPEFMQEARRLHLSEAVRNGKVNVAVMAQKPEALALLGLRSTPIYTRDVFAGPSADYLKESDFTNWAGNGTLAPEKPLPLSNTEENVASPLWHWNNANIVSSYPVLRPSEGDFDIPLTCGKDLIYTPLFSIRSGKGTIVFHQLETENRSKEDPSADYSLLSILKKYAEMKPKAAGAGILTGGKKEDILKQVEQGATAVLPAGYAVQFGLTEKKQTVNKFEITPAGKAYFKMLTPRDTYLRSPQSLTVLSGKDVVALTNPAFAVEKKFGKGKILFLEFPSDPQKAERERGLKQGDDSSVFWSAEILANRFAQMKELAEYACGKEPEDRMSDRFESMYLPQAAVDLNGDWEFRPDPDKKGLSEKWHKNTIDKKNWRICRVPGYYNNILPDVGTDPGYFWYRKTVVLPEKMRGKKLFLDLGAVDDLDEAYINGVQIGRTGEDTEGYWSARRLYPIPEKLTKNGTITIAVRVENLRKGNGGITGYARILQQDGALRKDSYPYTKNKAKYHTETHVRW